MQTSQDPSNVPPPKTAGACRVLHTADWHLGKTLGDLDRSEEHSLFLHTLFDLISAHEVNVLVVAGDVFDSAHPPQSAIRLYFDFLTQIYRHTNCQVVITAGNHDSPAQIDAPRQALHALRVHVVGAMPSDAAQIVIPLPSAENPAVVVAAVPFLRDRDLRTGQLGQSAEEIQSALRDGLRDVYARTAAAAAPWKERNVPIIALGHLTVLGALTSESERDIHVGGLGSVAVDVFQDNFDYVALGHLHRPQSVGGTEHVRYAGSPLPLSFSESGDAKEVRLLDFADGILVKNSSIRLPLSRALAQLSLSHADLEKTLAEFAPPECPLEPWVEVTVLNAPPDPGLADRVRGLMEPKRCKVLRVIAERAGDSAALTLGEEGSEQDTADLLGNPSAVFNHRLDQEPDLECAPRERLQTAFAELHNLWLEQQRESADPKEVPAP